MERFTVSSIRLEGGWWLNVTTDGTREEAIVAFETKYPGVEFEVTSHTEESWMDDWLASVTPCQSFS